MSKNYYIGIKKNFSHGVISQNVPYVILIRIFKTQEHVDQMNLKRNIKHLQQNYILARGVGGLKSDSPDIIIQLNYSKQKLEDVVNGQIYLELFYMLVDSKLDQFLIMKTMYGMNFIMKKKKDGYMLIHVKRHMIPHQYMSKDGEE